MTEPEHVTTIRIEFLSGRYHARPWGVAPEAQRVEWPPSPWRIARALVDVAYRHGLEDGLGELVRDLVSRPWRFTLPPAGELTVCSYQLPTRLPVPKAGTRFVQREAAKRPGHTDQSARTQLVRDTQVVLGAGDRTAWVHLPPLRSESLVLLGELVARLGRLGRAETWIRAALDPQPPAVNCGLESDGLPRGELRSVLCLHPDARFEDLLVRPVESRIRSSCPSGGQLVAYELPRPVAPPRETSMAAPPRIAGMRLRIGGRGVPAMRMPEFANAIRGAAKRSGDDWAGGLVLPVPDGQTISDVYVQFTANDPPGLAKALSGCTSLRVHGLDDRVQIGCVAVGEEALAPLRGPALVWESATPALVGLEWEIRGLIEQGGWPQPVEVKRITEHDRAKNGLPHWTAFVRLSPRDRTRLPAAGWRLWFADPIEGPLVLNPTGRSGYGLFLPKGRFP